MRDNYIYDTDFPLDDNELHDYSNLSVGSKESHIKVIGVGGGGGNVVAEILKKRLKDVDLLICNTDAQALKDNPINGKVMLGKKGLGAGLDPMAGKKAAEESIEAIKKELEGVSELIFIATCLGGGTGTGAAPVIAKVAKELGKLVIAVVTIPFRDEGKEFMDRAISGLKEIRKVVDSTIVIDNQKLYDPYGNMSAHEAFSKVNEVLVTAVQGISEIVTTSGKINMDMNDVRKVLSNSGTAAMGIGEATFEEGIAQAVENALSSPLLNDCNFESTKGALLCIACDDRKLPLAAINQASEILQKHTGNPKNFKRGLYTGASYGDKIYITVVIAGFELQNLPIRSSDLDNPIIDENGNEDNGPIPDKPDDQTIKMTDVTNPLTGEKLNNQNYTKRKIGEKPTLIVDNDEDIQIFETEPAFIRKERIRKEKMNLSNQSEIQTIKQIDNQNFFSTENTYLHKTQD